MRKAELINEIKKDFEYFNIEIPNDLQKKTITELRTISKNLKDEHTNNIGRDSDSNGFTPKFRKFEPGEPGEPGTGSRRIGQPDSAGKQKPEVSKSKEDLKDSLNSEQIDNDIQRHLQNYQFGKTTGVGDEFTEIEPEPTKRKRGKKAKIDTDGLITGYILLFVTNIIIPQLVVFAFNSVSKKIVIRSNEIKMDREQMNELRPIADAAAEYIAFKVNPVVLYGIIAGVMYTTNIIAVLEDKKYQ